MDNNEGRAVFVGDIAFNMRGDKTIGSDGQGAPIYKYSANHQTNSTGELPLNNLEWDNYTIEIDGTSTGYLCRFLQKLAFPSSYFKRWLRF